MPRNKQNRSRKPLAPAHSTGSRGWRQASVGLALILLVTGLVYLPALNGGLLLDDDSHLTKPELQSIGGLYRIWFEVGATYQYYPLLHSAFWFEHKLWNDSVLGYHVITLLWHMLAVSFVYCIPIRLKIPGALLAAAIFALHPVMVESVAWMSEQKNTLSTVFYLSAMLAYLKFDESRRRSNYFIALGLFVLGLLKKTVITATLPAALLVIFWWQRGDLSWKQDARPLMPFFVLGAMGGFVTAWVLLFVGSLMPVLGFLNVYAFIFSFVADHFQYLASLGIIVPVSAGIASYLERASLPIRRAGLALCILLVGSLAVLTFKQSRSYFDIVTFYRSILDATPTLGRRTIIWAQY